MTLIQSSIFDVSSIGNVSTANGYVISNGANSVDITAVEDFADENVQFTQSKGGGFTEGSALKIGGITVSAGGTFSFDFDFLTEEFVGQINDSFLLYVKGEDGTSEIITVVSILQNAADFELVNVEYGGPASLTDTFSYTFDTAGTYEVTLAVLDSENTVFDSAVSVKNFQVDGGGISPDESSPIGIIEDDTSPDESSPIGIVKDVILLEEPSPIGIGDASFQGEFDGINPTEGDSQYLITTGLISVSAAEIVTFAPGIDITPLENAGEFIEGSAVPLEPIVAEANQQLTFDYNFLTNEYPNSFYNDSFLLHVASADGTVSETVTLASIVQNEEDLVERAGDFNFHTGYQQGSYTFSTAGTYDITFAVVDAGDNWVDSAALVDNFQLI